MMGAMSISTGKGDDGTTGLMFGRRAAKDHPRLEACGAADELAASISLAMALCGLQRTKETLRRVQEALVALMGELATGAQDLKKYREAGFRPFSPEQVRAVEEAIHKIERAGDAPRSWLRPARSAGAAALDLARTVCRRAERRVVSLHRQSDEANPAILVYLNRLSDLLWLLAVEEERAESEKTDGEAL